MEIARKPRSLTLCNCSLCRRYGALWAYYGAKSVTITAARDAIGAYSWRNPKMRFCHCKTCGGLTHYEYARNRIVVNARMMDADKVANVPVKVLDGDKTWKTLGRAPHPDWFLSPTRAR